MRLSGTLGCVLLLWIALLVTSNFAQNSVRNSTRDDDDDDFVPYQGERFDVFDWALFREISRKQPGNVLISPISVKLALILLYEGAQGQTAYELAGALHLPASRSATRDKFMTILRSLGNPSCSECTLNLGTRLYIDSNVSTRQRYAAIIKTFYETDLINTNLSDSHHAAQMINNWVRNVTENNIEKIIEDEKKLEDSVMLVMNAIYFKDAWRRQYFLPNNTQIGKFFTGPDSHVNVEFMHSVGRFYFSESSKLDAKIIRIPYESTKLSMYIILPYSVNGIDQLINEINPFILSRHLWLMQDLPVALWIPKFKFDFTSHLENTLRELGIHDIFDSTATLTGIAKTKRTSRRLFVTDIIQKTGIEVNERGTTAYAATEVDIGNKIQEEMFYANHPFVFYIEDESTGTILYVGKVVNPLETVGELESPKMFPTRFGAEPPIMNFPSGK